LTNCQNYQNSSTHNVS